MDPGDVIIMTLLGMLLGALGQAVRFIAGSAPRDPKFQKTPALVGLATSLLVGVAAGGIGAVTFLGETITSEDVVKLIVIGYAGTDFVEQFVKTRFPEARGT